VVGAGAACLWGGCGNGHQLRSVLIDGEPWFVAADACRCLGMDVSKGTDHHCRKLDKDERGLVSRNDHPVLFTGCRASLLAIISRPGLFKLIQRSNKPEAKEFDRWVRHEVLPQVMAWPPQNPQKSCGYSFPLWVKPTLFRRRCPLSPPESPYGWPVRRWRVSRS